jgi:hypothetical protein
MPPASGKFNAIGADCATVAFLAGDILVGGV